MNRTMINSLSVLLWALLLSGCSSQDYQQQPLTPDSPTGREIQQMLDALAETDAEALERYIDRYGATDLNDQQTRGLTAALRSLAGGQPRLSKLDRFGDNVVRAGIEPAEGRPLVWMLLIETDDGLRWAGPN